MTNYLVHLPQYVCRGVFSQTTGAEYTSKSMSVPTGVPQGSILGPMLFLCYINDITCIAKNSNIMLYADDTVLYKCISDDCRFLVMHDFKEDVRRMYEWCQKNRLSINVKKTLKLYFIHIQLIL